MTEQAIIEKCDALIKATGLSETYVSRLVFNDGKRLDQLRNGGQMFTPTRERVTKTIRRLEHEHKTKQKKRRR